MPSDRTALTTLATDLRRLGLNRTADELNDRIAEATRKRWSATVLLEHLVADELEDKQRRSVESRLTRARLGRFKPLADWNWEWPTALDRLALERILTLDFLARGENVILVGAQGLGKTMLAKNIAHQAVLAGHSALFTTAADLLLNLNGQETGRALERRLRHYTRPTLLVIDELGYLAYDARAADLIFQLVSRRYEHRSLLITTNLPFKRWDTVFPNASCAVALIDRLTHHVEILLIEGRSYRGGRPSSASRSATASIRTVMARRNDRDPHVVNETGRPLSRKRHFLKLDNTFRGDSNQASAYPRLSGGQPSLETVPNTVGLSPSGALPSGHSRGVLVRCRGKGGRPAMAVTTGFQGRTFDVPRTGVPCIDLPSRAPCAAADAVFADAKAFLSSSEARQMSESELERELHRRRQDLVRKLLQGHRDQRSPKEAAGPAEDTSGVECSEPHEHESHAETTSGTMQVVGLGCARRGHDGLHRLDAALNLLPERYLVEMRRRVTIATASRAPPRTPWKPQWYSTSSTWQRRRGVRCSSSAHRRACRHLVRDPMGVDRRTVTLGCSCGGSQPPQAAGVLMRTETSHEAREDQRKSPIGR